MATVPQPAPHARAGTDAVTAVLLIVGVTQLATGAFAFLAPGAFYDAIAAYPPENHHFLMDVGSWQVALGAIALYGARRAEWRVPLLGLIAIQYLLHGISHAIDVDLAEEAWQGWSALAAQVVGFVALAGLFLRERAR
ncbi:MAG TPA: hypothetical protein VGW75_16650 [Solirubrobacteraceae bacterium]|jgi:hypothetical protein|nr:hypothetical protein [Solirubrobacteraceae bacterium]